MLGPIDGLKERLRQIGVTIRGLEATEVLDVPVEPDEPRRDQEVIQPTAKRDRADDSGHADGQAREPGADGHRGRTPSGGQRHPVPYATVGEARRARRLGATLARPALLGERMARTATHTDASVTSATRDDQEDQRPQPKHQCVDS